MQLIKDVQFKSVHFSFSMSSAEYCLKHAYRKHFKYKNTKQQQS